jgi:hypothetical protein
MSSQSQERIRQRDSESEKEATSIPPKNIANVINSQQQQQPRSPPHSSQNFNVKEAPHLPATTKNNNNNGTFSPATVSPSRHHDNHHHHQPTSLSSKAESSCVKTIHQHQESLVAVVLQQQQQMQQLRQSGASPERHTNNNDGGDRSPRHSDGFGSKQNSDLGAAIPEQSPGRSSGGTSSTSSEASFVAKASSRLATSLAITTTTTTTPVPSAEVLSALAREICEKMYDNGGLESAQLSLGNLVMALDDPANEQLRAKIRNRVISTTEVARLKLTDLLTEAQKAELQKEAEQDFKEHNVKDIILATSTMTKETCPSCGHKEAAILESNNQGGEARFWSGADVEEGQQLTLYSCVNCGNEWSGESKF